MSWKTALPNRFWRKVDVYPGGCWYWSAGKWTSGYGCFWWKGKRVAAHRVVASMALGFDLDSDKMVCHHCDNRQCVNPEHLFIGDAFDNMRDCVRKGRHAKHGCKGEVHYLSTLTESQVLDARLRRENGERTVDIAKDMGVHPKTLGSAVRKDSWRWLNP